MKYIEKEKGFEILQGPSGGDLSICHVAAQCAQCNADQ